MAKWILPVCGALLVSGVAPTMVSTPVHAASKGRLCKVDIVAVIEKRLHVKCVPEQDAYTREIIYYAMLLTEPVVKTEAVIAMAIESKKLNKPVRIWFDDADYASVPGCQGSDCRKLLGLALE
jgi:hypothetical protein